MINSGPAAVFSLIINQLKKWIRQIPTRIRFTLHLFDISH